MRRGRVGGGVVTVTVRAPVHPTEDPQRVEEAVRNLFPQGEVEVRPREVLLEGGGLERLRTLLWNHQIVDTARQIMLRGHHGTTVTFKMGKQAAYVGKPHVGAERAPLGELDVTVRGETEEEVLRAVYETAPDTTVPPEMRTVPPRWREAEN